MNTDYKNIFTQSSCLTNDELTNYVSSNLSVNDIRKVELHIADCQMCNDELEGLQILNDNEKLPIINASLNSKIDSYFNKKDISIQIINEEKKSFNFKKTFSIAASIALLITGAFFIYDLKNNVSSENIAEINVSDKTILKEEVAIIESAKPEEPKIEGNEVLTSSAEEDKTEIYSNNNSPSLKENITPIVEAESPNQFVENTDTDDEITEISEEEVLDVVLSDNISVEDNDKRTKDEELNSEKNKPSFGTTRGSKILMKKKATKSYKYLKDSGLLSFNIKSYNDAISDFNKYLHHNPNDFEVVFKTGMSYYYIKNYDAAILKFNKITSTQNIKYFEDAQWYKANALMNQNKKDEALTILNKIVEDAGKFSQKAKIKISKISN